MSQDCINKLKEFYSEEDLNSSTVKSLLKEIDEAQDLSKLGATTKEVDDFTKRLLERKAEEIELKALQEKQRLLKVTYKLGGVMSDSHYRDGKWLVRPIETIQDLYEGSPYLTGGASRNIQTDGGALDAKYTNMMVHQLDEVGLLNKVKTGEINREIFEEMWELREGGSPGKTKNADAQEAAKILGNTQKALLKEMQMSGSSVRDMDGYIMRQTHDMELIRNAGYQKWKEDIFPLLDVEKTFGKNYAKAFGPDSQPSADILTKYKGKVDNFLTEIFEKIVRGEFHLDPNDGGARRVLHFKDGAKFYDYNVQYGNKEILEGVVASIKSTARKAAIIDNLGVNHRQTWDDLIDHTKTILRNQMEDARKIKDPKEMAAAIDKTSKAWDEFTHGISSLEKTYNEMIGITTMPSRNMAGRTAHNLRTLISMKSLGKAVFAGITDLPNSVMLLRASTGKGFFESYHALLTEFFKTVKGKNKRVIAKRLYMILEDDLADIHSRHSGEAGGPGMITKMSRLFFKYSGFNWQATSSRGTIAKQFAIELGDVADLQIGQLNPRMRANMVRYGITGTDWDVMRKAVDNFDEFRALTPEKILEIPDAELKADLDRRNVRARRKFTPDEYRRDLELKLAAYLADHAELGSPVPKGRERRLLLQGTEADSTMGIMLRFLAQFRTFPFVMHRYVKRVLNADPQHQFKASNLYKPWTPEFQQLGLLVAQTTAFGYLAGTLKDLASGKTPKDPTDPKVALDAFINGGSGGIYADLLLGDYDKLNRSVTGTLAGPTGSVLDDVGELWAKARKGDLDAGKVLQKTINNMPGQNLWWARWAADYVLLNGLNEWMNPGHSSRIKRAVRKNPGLFEKRQRFLGGPFGPDKSLKRDLR